MCGIVGIRDAGGVSFSLYYALFALQHRGQESAGISTFDGVQLYKHKGQGLVAEVFDPALLRGLEGYVGIGHVRYPTTGANKPENAQPFNFLFRDHIISIAHNGNLVNACELRDEYEARGQIFCTTTDTELIAKVITDEMSTSGCIEDAVHRCMRILKGSYSVVLMMDGILYGFRDPLGIKPMCIGKTSQGIVLASESVAVDALGGTFLRDLKPGELVCIDEDGMRAMQIAVSDCRAHCIFEYIYFARADSILDGALVYDVRRNIGGKLHEEAPVNADSICPVPDSGTAYAIGYSKTSHIPFVESLMKNRYMGRTFIMPSQIEREKAVRMKLNPIGDHLKGKSIVLVDDSIVRGTTSRRIINIIRDAGAKEVHVRIGSPAIKAPCYLGVDIPTREELIASDKNEEEVRGRITANSLHHISLEALVESIGIERKHLCTGCLTGCYPVSITGEQSQPPAIDFLDGTYQTKLELFE
ncbi:MAG TPA: amidophosphoribosyltransferase [Methanoregulaceae archaeon]|nr:amidophosphoribosyltransferase [Methanoregulaceae archaeon]HOH81601.1 amidophosphoribosyltransferase [Methanoregulaceae archaeon]HPW10348.1 amidophosphoribosyltransferase [Methanoregulaceae archaeon]HQM55964.1 amidophosphoribosyltransferase [Methanoregulaceae archaeon]